MSAEVLAEPSGSEETYRCPGCYRTVPVTGGKCPVCGTYTPKEKRS